jgi:uncharacterized protein (TIGR03032 family)
MTNTKPQDLGKLLRKAIPNAADADVVVGNPQQVVASKLDGQDNSDDTPNVEISRLMVQWLQDERVSLAVCLYQSNAIVTLGVTLDSSPEGLKFGVIPSVWISDLPRVMSIAQQASRKRDSDIWVGHMGQFSRFVLQPDPLPDSDIRTRTPFDGHYCPRESRIVNNVDIHDSVVLDDGAGNDEIYFVNSRYSCVCSFSKHSSFRVVWRPPWITATVPEDRCHLNGLCAYQNKLKYVTAASRNDLQDGWRNHRRDGGVLYDIENKTIVCAGLSMPHSPRVHEGRVWVLNSGTGYLGYVDFEKTVTMKTTIGGEETVRPFVPKTFIQGFARGLDFVGTRYAVVGCSIDRHVSRFQGLALGEKLAAEGLHARCGVFIVDLRSFGVIHNVTFETSFTEMYDVAVLPGISRPVFNSVGFSEEIVVEEEGKE